MTDTRRARDWLPLVVVQSALVVAVLVVVSMIRELGYSVFHEIADRRWLP